MMRNIYIHPYIVKNIIKNTKNLSVKKAFLRASLITPELVGTRFKVHNGKEFILLSVVPDMVGYRFGEFIWTRSRYEFKKKKKKKK